MLVAATTMQPIVGGSAPMKVLSLLTLLALSVAFGSRPVFATDVHSVEVPFGGSPGSKDAYPACSPKLKSMGEILADMAIAAGATAAVSGGVGAPAAAAAAFVGDWIKSVSSQILPNVLDSGFANCRTICVLLPESVQSSQVHTQTYVRKEQEPATPYKQGVTNGSFPYFVWDADYNSKLITFKDKRKFLAYCKQARNWGNNWLYVSFIAHY
jgi:hypothetical protein